MKIVCTYNNHEGDIGVREKYMTHFKQNLRDIIIYPPIFQKKYLLKGLLIN